jgi:hypothetical protein
MVQTGNLWEDTVDRIGRWVDFKGAYKTMDKDYMESVWWAFKELYDKGKIYEGERVLMYCTRDATPLSKAEVTMDAGAYQDVTDPSVYVKFKLTDGSTLLAWTTTPWTLPANTAIAVNSKLTYVEVELDGEKFILAKELLPKVLVDEKHQPLQYKITKELKGSELVGKSYEPLLGVNRGDNAHKVWHAPYVSVEDGTGIVHIAPAYGEEDFELAQKKSIPVVHSIDQNGYFTEGEWDESDDEMVSWKEHLYNSLKLISQYTEDKFSIIDVKGFDKYRGPYGLVKINGKNYKIWTTDDDLLWIEDYPVDNTSSEGESAGFKGNVDDIINLINDNYDKNRSTTLRTVPGTDFSLNELTSSGPTISGSEGGYKDGAQSGSGGYNTKNSWKKTPYAKAQQKKPKVTHDYKVVPQNESEKEIKDKEASDKNSSVEKLKTNRNYDPETGNQNWENTNQKNAPKSSNDDFWTEVDLIPGSGYVPKGMDKNYVSGLHDRPGDMKKLGLDENKKPDLTKKKFFTESENKERGINKRYLITEKTTEEYEKERFKKLSTFKTRESIKEAEEMNTFFDSLQENKDPERLLNFKKVLNENDFFDETEQETIKPNNKKETIDVEKPNSKFGLTYKFFKSDFLNESKQFIFDINSSVYVKNPNFSNKK